MPQVVYLFRDKVRPGQSCEVSRGQIQLLYVCVFGPNYQDVYFIKKIYLGDRPQSPPFHL